MSIDITIEEMEALPAESYELFDIRGEIERAHGILPNSTASSADVLMENPPEDKERRSLSAAAEDRSAGISQKNCRSRDMKHTA